ncbi:MAG: recombinase family protein [Clostridiales bacterium]|jgi:site-specific DNA recombinase|nr:recombinase family protein [Clostridiales bacterium]
MIAIYARVSTEEQVRKGYSLQDQIRACRKLANSNEIVEFVDEGISGEILDRPELSKLRKAIREGIVSKVICLDPDRLSRKLMNQLIISEEIEKKSSLVFVNGEYNQTAEGKLFYQLRGAISEFEKTKINERMCRGRKEKARQGKVVRDYNIYGYDYDNDTQLLIINPFEARIVTTVFQLFTERNKLVQGINGIAKYLTDSGIPTKRGAPVWHRQVVRQMLMNKAYIGEFYQNRWNCEGMLSNRFKSPEDRIKVSERPKDDWILVPSPPIIDKDVFNYAQQLLHESRRRWAGTSKNQYLLSGLVRCDVCGNTMPGRRSKNWGKYIFEYFDQKNTIGSKYKGCGRKIRAEELDSMVWDIVYNLLSTQAVIPDDDNFALHSLKNPEASRIEIRLSEIKKSRRNLINLIAYSGEDLGENGVEEIHIKLKNLKNEEIYLANLKQDFIIHQKDNDLAVRSNLVGKAYEYYLNKKGDALPFEVKKQLIQYVIREIRVCENEIKVFGF